MLQCKGCSAVLSPNNPSQASNQHSNSCKRWPEEEEDVIDLDEDDDGEGSSRPGKRKAGQQAQTPYMPSAERQAAVNMDLLRFIISSESPLPKLNNKYLRQPLEVE